LPILEEITKRAQLACVRHFGSRHHFGAYRVPRNGLAGVFKGIKNTQPIVLKEIIFAWHTACNSSVAELVSRKECARSGSSQYIF
jgi:hypothetical protein